VTLVLAASAMAAADAGVRLGAIEVEPPGASTVNRVAARRGVDRILVAVTNHGATRARVEVPRVEWLTRRTGETEWRATPARATRLTLDGHDGRPLTVTPGRHVLVIHVETLGASAHHEHAARVHVKKGPRTVSLEVPVVAFERIPRR